MRHGQLETMASYDLKSIDSQGCRGSPRPIARVFQNVELHDEDLPICLQRTSKDKSLQLSTQYLLLATSLTTSFTVPFALGLSQWPGAAARSMLNTSPAVRVEQWPATHQDLRVNAAE